MSLSRPAACASAMNAASAAAGFSAVGQRARGLHRERRARAAASTSSPVSAAGTRPKTVSAENRPPTVGGDETSARKPSVAASVSSEEPGSVIAMKRLPACLAAERLVGHLAEDRVERQRLDRAARLARDDVERRGGIERGQRTRRSCAAPWCRARAAWRRPTRRAPTRAPATRATSRPCRAARRRSRPPPSAIAASRWSSGSAGAAPSREVGPAEAGRGEIDVVRVIGEQRRVVARSRATASSSISRCMRIHDEILSGAAAAGATRACISGICPLGASIRLSRVGSSGSTPAISSGASSALGRGESRATTSPPATTIAPPTSVQPVSGSPRKSGGEEHRRDRLGVGEDRGVVGAHAAQAAEEDHAGERGLHERRASASAA